MDKKFAYEHRSLASKSETIQKATFSYSLFFRRENLYFYMPLEKSALRIRKRSKQKQIDRINFESNRVYFEDESGIFVYES
jgi:hypothetical protein